MQSPVFVDATAFADQHDWWTILVIVGYPAWAGLAPTARPLRCPSLKALRTTLFTSIRFATFTSFVSVHVLDSLLDTYF